MYGIELAFFYLSLDLTFKRSFHHMAVLLDPTGSQHSAAEKFELGRFRKRKSHQLISSCTTPETTSTKTYYPNPIYQTRLQNV